MIVEWPHPDLAPKVHNFRLINRTRSAGESLTGFEQVSYPVTQRWAFSLTFNNLKRHTVPAYRAMIASLQGRANALRFPIFDEKFWPSDVELGIAFSPHSDGTPFSDGSLYLTSDIGGIEVSGLAGEKELEVDFGSYGAIFGVGLYFGVGDETYLSTSVIWSGSVATIRFEPGLRQDHTAATFRLRPRIITRLAADESGEHPLDFGLVTAPRLDLVEVLPDELDAMEAAA